LRVEEKEKGSAAGEDKEEREREREREKERERLGKRGDSPPIGTKLNVGDNRLSRMSGAYLLQFLWRQDDELPV